MTGPAYTRASKRRGIATLFAVLMLTLIGAALAATSSLLATEQKRTQAAEQESQLRQALLAGESLVVNQLEADGLPDHPLVWSLPTAPASTVTAELRPDSDGGFWLSLEARQDDAVAWQVSRVGPSADGGWAIAGRRLQRTR